MIYQRGTKTPENVWAFFVNGTATMPIYQTLFEKLKKAIPETDAVVGLHCGDPDRFLKISPGEVINCMADVYKRQHTGRFKGIRGFFF